MVLASLDALAPLLRLPVSPLELVQVLALLEPSFLHYPELLLRLPWVPLDLDRVPDQACALGIAVLV